MSENLERKADFVDFPKLCYPRSGVHACIQLNASAIPDGYWASAVEDIAKSWVQEKHFEGVGTIWSFCSPSVDFQALTSNEFILACKLPRFADYLFRQLNEMVRDCAKRGYVQFRKGNGWATICHIQEGKVWLEMDPSLWSLA